MQAADTFASMHGRVSGTWLNVLTGERRPLDMRSNQLSYACADSIARAFAGDTAYVPRYIGFVYGATGKAESLSPTTGPTARDQSWENLAANLKAVEDVNIQISPMSRTPVVNVDNGTLPGAIYTGNAVTFSACTRSGGTGGYGFDAVTDPSYAGYLGTNSCLYHAILFGKVQSRYIPLARVSLVNSDGSTFPLKPADFELELSWTISFY